MVQNLKDDRDTASGRFLPGNRIWEARSSAGRKPKFEGSEALVSACLEYFEWVEANPLFEAKLVSYQGSSSVHMVPKMRAMTQEGLCNFLDIAPSTWVEWRKSRPDLSGVIEWVESVIFQQKFEGAAADLLNGNIISRDLGLADRSEISREGAAEYTKEVSLMESARQVAFMLAEAVEVKKERERRGREEGADVLGNS